LQARNISICVAKIGLGELLKLIERDSQLAQNPEKKRRANITASMKRNRNGAAIRVIPSFMAA
jgi:hypothetical protein